MAKKKAATGSQKKRAVLWPGDFTATHAIVALSLMLNVALVAVLIALAQTNIFDDVIAQRGAEVLCSDEYQEASPDRDTKALLEYSCAEPQAKKFFLNGYNEYRKSINLQPVEE